MNPEQLLSQLAPLRTPEPIGWWPPAPGWWVLAALMLMAVAVALTVLVKRRRKSRYRRRAALALRQIAAHPNAVPEINRLLKITALTAYGDHTAVLSGDAWVAFLATSCPQVSAEALEPLAHVYGPSTPSSDSDLVNAALTWIRQHETKHV